jgi:predicted secreted protein
MRRLGFSIVIALALIVLSEASAPAAPRAKVLTFADSGTTVTLVPGQRLRVRLEVCHGCGYHWETRRAPDPRVLRRQHQRTSGGCKPPCAGGLAVTSFRYVARARGRTRLRLAYVPPGSSTAGRTFRLRVHVR